MVPRSTEPWQRLLTSQRWEFLAETVRMGQVIFADRPIWCVNSTADGGGVAEMLRTILSYVRGAGLEARWAVIDGNAEFFAITKRLHNFIHGSPGDGGVLGPHERRVYDEVLAANLPGLLELMAPGTTVLLHDPQTAGLVRPLQEHGCAVAWRCHIGVDRPNEFTHQGWAFVEPLVRQADRLVFSSSLYIPDVFLDRPIAVIPPSIDPFAPKNQDLDGDTVRAILLAAGLLSGGSADAAPVYRRLAGDMAPVRCRADLLDGGSAPHPERPIVLQVSRWDRLKDHLGVMKGFLYGASEAVDSDTDLMLAGPDARSIADDPEGSQVLAELLTAHSALPERLRKRVHIASLPIHDADENAAIVNALQRHASVVVQKSLQEGFGLTVTEAMWKERPVVASAVGGIREQVRDQCTGVLLDDPRDLDVFGQAVSSLLNNPSHACQLAVAGRENVLNRFLHDRHIRQYVEVLAPLQVQVDSSQVSA